VRIVFMGSPEFAVPVLQQLQDNGHEIAAVYTRTDKPAGRGREPTPPPIKSAALEMGLPVVQAPHFKTPEYLRQLADFQPRAIVVAAYGLILPQTVLDIAPLGGLNIHPSWLPLYRGASPVVSALLAGDAFAGVSVMQLDAGMDSGALLARASVAVRDEDDAQSLTVKLFAIGANLLLEALAGDLGAIKRAEPQNAAHATFTREIVKEDGRIDWRLSAAQIWRMVRAYQPWPQAYTFWQGKQIKILQAQPLPLSSANRAGAVPGQVLAEPSGGFPAVVAGDGLLVIRTLQMEGKKALPADDFLRGRRDFLGARLE